MQNFSNRPSGFYTVAQKIRKFILFWQFLEFTTLYLRNDKEYRHIRSTKNKGGYLPCAAVPFSNTPGDKLGVWRDMRLADALVKSSHTLHIDVIYDLDLETLTSTWLECSLGQDESMCQIWSQSAQPFDCLYTTYFIYQDSILCDMFINPGVHYMYIICPPFWLIQISLAEF